MNVQFYCSSKTGAGYRLSEFGRDGALKPIQAGGPATMFFNMGGLDYVLMRSGSEILLILKRIAPPGTQTRRADFSGADIFVNLAFSAQDLEEARLRALAVYALCEKEAFSEAVYAAYNHCAGGELGYDFDRDIIKRLIERAASTQLDKLAANAPPLPESQYGTLNEQKTIAMLRGHTLGGANGVFFARTEMSYNDYVSAAGRQNLPWYVISDVYKAIPAQSDTPMPIWKKLLHALFFRRNGRLDIKKSGIVLGVCAVLVLICCLALPSGAPDKNTPLNTSTPAPTAAGRIETTPAVTTARTPALTARHATPLKLSASLTPENPGALAGEQIAWSLNAEGIGKDWIVDLSLTRNQVEFIRNWSVIQDKYAYDAKLAGTYTLEFRAYSPDASQSLYAKSDIVSFEPVSAPGLSFEMRGGILSVIDYTGGESKLIIPDALNGVPVTSISSGAFSDTYVTWLVLGENIISISNKAFDNWGGVTIEALPGTNAREFAESNDIRVYPEARADNATAGETPRDTNANAPMPGN